MDDDPADELLCEVPDDSDEDCAEDEVKDAAELLDPEE